MFNPTEIIFSATTACNLHCAHCFVNRDTKKISSEDAINFLKSAVEADSNIKKIGFSGGEPFLYFDFILTLTKAALEMDLMFDQIMTNGDWWNNESDLTGTLQQLYDAGYDGKIGLSWDKFHGQTSERMHTFIRTVQNIFGEDSINIQRVAGGESLPLATNSSPSATEFSATPSNGEFPVTPPDIPTYILPQSFPSSDSRAWQAKKWFKDDFCEGPGQILYIHADGNIAPCCGFANENKELFIGNIKQDYVTVMKQALENKMVNICYEKGLGKYKKVLKKQLKQKGQKFPGKCNDICSFCDFVCHNLKV